MTLHDLILFALFVAASAHFLSTAVALARALGAQSASPPAPADAPGVSVLRPVCGIENYIEETLASTFAINYPRYEVIFCVEQKDDPAIPLIKMLIAAHPERDTRLLIGDDRISINPKLNNLVKGWNDARHDWIVMSDSNVLLPPDYLNRLFERWQSDVGIVCSLPAGDMPENFWADLECAFLNTLQARWMLFAESIGFGFAQGKTMFVRKQDFESVGGIASLASEPAEDIAATNIVRRMGRKIKLARMPFPVPLGRRQFAHVWARQLRWARLRRVCYPVVTFFEPLTSLVVVVALAIAAGYSVPSLVALVSAWYLSEAALAHAAGWPLSWRSPFAWVARDVLLVPLLISAWFSREVVWRGNAMHLARAQPTRSLRPES